METINPFDQAQAHLAHLETKHTIMVLLVLALLVLLLFLLITRSDMMADATLDKASASPEA